MPFVVTRLRAVQGAEITRLQLEQRPSHKPAEHIRKTAMNEMLLIQDDAGVGRAMGKMLLANDYERITWIGGVSSTELVSGALQGLDIRRQPLLVNLSEYVLAFVDGNLKIGVAQGWTLVPILRQAGIICIGMSTIYGERLGQSGAEHVIDPFQFQRFIEKDLAGIYKDACARRTRTPAT
jgi:hypothetical protein